MPAVPLVLPALLLATAELILGVRAEEQAGQAPTLSNPQASFYTAGILQPEIGLRVLAPTSDTLVLEAPRLLLRRPNVANIDRPLFLNLVRAEHRGYHGERLAWQAELISSAGEVDYLTLAQALGAQAALPTTMKLITVDGNAQLGWRCTRRLSLITRVVGIRRQPWGAQATSTVGPGLPTETDGRIEPRLEYGLTTRQTSILRTRFAIYHLAGTLHLQAVEAEVWLGWRYRLSRYSRLELAAGVAFAHAEERSDPSRPWRKFSPLADFGLHSETPVSRTAILRAHLTAGIDWYLDPVLSAALPRGQVSANVALDLDTEWHLELYGLAATNLSRHPMSGLPIETLISAGLPFRYRLARHWLLDFGGRFSERGPHWAAPDFSWSQHELFGYVALTATTQ